MEQIGNLNIFYSKKEIKDNKFLKLLDIDDYLSFKNIVICEKEKQRFIDFLQEKNIERVVSQNNVNLKLNLAISNNKVVLINVEKIYNNKDTYYIYYFIDKKIKKISKEYSCKMILNKRKEKFKFSDFIITEDFIQITTRENKKYNFFVKNINYFIQNKNKITFFLNNGAVLKLFIISNDPDSFENLLKSFDKKINCFSEKEIY